jgi:HlyD family secretion protein
MRLAVDLRRYLQLRWTLGFVLLAVALIPAVGLLFHRADALENSLPGAGHLSSGLPITAVGRVQPKDGVMTLAAPASAETGPAIVTALHVHQGDWVREGQLLATLRGREELQALLVGRERQVTLARTKLDALKAGAKEDDLKALHAEVQSEEAGLALAQTETLRARQLHDQKLLPTASLESQESRLKIAAQSLEASRARLHGLSTARPADIAVAEAELHAADADADQIRARLQSTQVHAPADGRILAIYAQPGQIVGMEGLLAFGKTAEMFVDAEVLEEDMARARVGQKASITGDMLPDAVHGTVEEIGYLIGSREVFKNDPTAFADSRVVHVKIRADNPELLARFINARVTAVIQQ